MKIMSNNLILILPFKMNYGELSITTKSLINTIHLKEEIETLSLCHLVHSKECQTINMLSHGANLKT